MKRISMAEKQLYEKLKQKYLPNLTLEDSEFTTHDCYSFAPVMFIELKCRDIHYDELLIEKVKYDALINKPGPVRYVSETPKGCWVFDIKKLPEPCWYEKLLPDTTRSSWGNHELVWKMVGKYNINQGKFLVF